MRAPLVFFMFCVCATSTAVADDRAEISALYAEVSRAIVAEDLAAITKLGYRSFDASDGEAANIWKANFQSVAEYGPVDFAIEDIADEDGAQWVTVTRKIFFRFEPRGAQQFEEGRSRDRWVRDGDTWRFAAREALGAPLNGEVAVSPVQASPRLRALRDALRRNETDALDRFWAECAGKGPLVEEIADDATQRLVTFLWRDDSSTERVEVRGGPFENSRTPFERLDGTDVWHHTETLPSDSRYVYSLIVRRKVARSQPNGGSEHVLVDTYPLDPLNPLVFNAGAVLELPDAPRDTWHVPRDDVAHGALRRLTIDSKVLGEKREVRLYVSPQNEGSPPPTTLAIFLDGEDCEHLMSTPTVLDNLVAEKRIPPIVAVLVDSQGARGRDLIFHDPFVQFLADEVVPFAAEKCQARFTAPRTVISGMSLGGLTSAYAAQLRPDIFGNVLSQSGSFWRRRPDASSLPEGWFPGEVARRGAPDVRYYLEVGRFEAPGMVENNRRMRDVLLAHGRPVIYHEYHGGHDHVNWRVSVGNALIALFGETAR